MMGSIRVGRPLAAAIVLVCASQGCQGGCSLGQVKPLPAPLPKDQTVEGGVQVRIAPAGFSKLESALPDLLRTAFADGVCVPHQRYGTVGSFSSLEICGGYGCAGGAEGCRAQIAVDSMSFQVPDGGPLTVDTVFEITSLPLEITWFGAASCTMDITTTAPAHVVADVVFATDPQTGVLAVHLAPGGVRMATLPLRYQGCSVLAPIANSLQPLLGTSIGQAIVQALSPLFDQILQQFLPEPLGVQGLIDSGALVHALSPSTQAHMEARIVPGGYVDVRGGGLSLGVIAGLNSDLDPTTRNPGTNGVGTYHEHARCVPDLPLVLPDLPRQPTRGTFSLSPVPAFAGLPEPPGDFAIGVSRRFLQMAGFHIVNSGTLCLGLGAAELGLPFNVGTVAIVIPSLATLADDGKASMFIVLRPQRALDLDVGTGARDGSGNVTDPALKLLIHELKADLYAFLDQRYVRAFTLGIDLNVGVDLQFTSDAMGNPALQPVLQGINTQNLQISVENTALLSESQDRLQMVFPMLAQLLVPVLSGQLKPVTLPRVGGFTLGQLRMGRVDAGQERFMAIYASLQRATPLLEAPRLSTRARVAALVVPPPEVIRDAVMLPEGPTRTTGLARVTLELDADGAGPTDVVEWQWRADGGLWRPYQRDPRPTLALPEFLLQGHHFLEVRARANGDWKREDLHPVRLDMLIDSVPPSLRPHVEGDLLVLGGSDLVTADQALRYQVQPVGGDWRALPDGTLTRSQAEALAAPGGGWLDARVRDEAGNLTALRVDVGAAFHGRETQAAGCNCSLGGARGGGGGGGSGRRGAGGWLALLLGAGALALRRRRTAALALAMGAVLVVAGCGDEITTTPCTTDSDCSALPCATGALPLCGDDRQCTCAMEIPLGHVGRFSSVATAGGQALVSAYNDTYGDLMLGQVAPPGVIRDWQFIDGVPAGPVVLPQSNVRGGIRAAGDDVGRYTSIAIGPSQQPLIAYYDVTHGA
ncbi:MAG TPA: hypothetical protein VKN99_12930, partial [Polyangia bacterium]|nr:hypothetical protein [Polyangia bacterium]